MLLQLLLLLLISIWCHCGLYIVPQCLCYSVRSHGSQEKVLGHFQATSDAGRFWEAEMFLDTSATAWALHRLSRTRRTEARVQAGLSWDMVSWQWEVSRVVWSSSYFHALKGPSGIWYTIRELWSSRHAVIIPGSSTMGCQAYLHLPAMWFLMLSWWWQRVDPNQVTVLSVKGKATLALWSSSSIWRAVWRSSGKCSAKTEPAQPGVHPRVPHARMV